MLARRLVSVSIIFLFILSHYSCLAHITTTPTTDQHIKIVVFNQKLNDPISHPKGTIKEVFYHGSSTSWEYNLSVRPGDDVWLDWERYQEFNKMKEKFINEPFFTRVNESGKVEITIEKINTTEIITETLPLGFSEYYTDKLTPGVYKITASVLLQEEKEVTIPTGKNYNRREEWPDIPLYGTDSNNVPWILYKVKEFYPNQSAQSAPPAYGNTNNQFYSATVDYKLQVYSYYLATGSTITYLDTYENEDLATVFVYTDWNKIRTTKPVKPEEQHVTISDVYKTTVLESATTIIEQAEKKGFGIPKLGLLAGGVFTYIDYAGNSEYGVTRAAGSVSIAIVSATVVNSAVLAAGALPISAAVIVFGTGIVAVTIWDEILNVFNNAEISEYIGNGIRDELILVVDKKPDDRGSPSGDIGNSKVTLINNGVDLYEVQLRGAKSREYLQGGKQDFYFSEIVPNITHGQSYTFNLPTTEYFIDNIKFASIVGTIPLNGNPQQRFLVNRGIKTVQGTRDIILKTSNSPSNLPCIENQGGSRSNTNPIPIYVDGMVTQYDGTPLNDADYTITCSGCNSLYLENKITGKTDQEGKFGSIWFYNPVTTSLCHDSSVKFEILISKKGAGQQTSFISIPVSSKTLPIDIVNDTPESVSEPPWSLQSLLEILYSFLNQVYTSIQQWTAPIQKAVFGPSPEEIAVENAISAVTADMDAMANLISSLNEFVSGMYQVMGQVPPPESRASFTYQIIDAQYFRDEASARTFMISNGAGTKDIDEAIGIIDEYGLGQNGYVIVMTEATSTTSSGTETARGPIVCNEQGQPYYKSWQFFQKLKEQVSGSQSSGQYSSQIVSPMPQMRTAMIAGTYQGYYLYDGNIAKYPFTITVHQSGGTLTGTIREPRSTFGPNTPYLDSTLQGTVSGNSVYFVKTYAYDNHQVSYNGVYYPGTRQILGRWNIGSSGGAFTINT